MKKRKISAIILIAFVFAAGSCTLNKIYDGKKTILLRQSESGQDIIIEIEKGDNWISTKQAGIFLINVLPQFAIWIENSDHELIDTLYVSGADFEKLRNAKKQKLGKDYFQQCLPLWAKRTIEAGGFLPDPETPYPDTITSATPMDSFDLFTKTTSQDQEISIFLEINQPGDYNEKYTSESSDWLGQPGIIYRAVISAGSVQTSIEFQIIGHSGDIDSFPVIYTGLEQIDSALDIIKSAVINLE